MGGEIMCVDEVSSSRQGTAEPKVGLKHLLALRKKSPRHFCMTRSFKAAIDLDPPRHLDIGQQSQCIVNQGKQRLAQGSIFDKMTLSRFARGQASFSRTTFEMQAGPLHHKINI